ncbi:MULTISPECIES: hypothetical protein [Undibacterium]|nr:MULTISPECIES: hypothetical protein [Undibacterium]
MTYNIPLVLYFTVMGIAVIYAVYLCVGFMRGILAERENFQ